MLRSVENNREALTQDRDTCRIGKDAHPFFRQLNQEANPSHRVYELQFSSGKESQYIDRVVAKALEQLSTDEQKTAFAKAMAMSVKINGREGEIPKPCSPKLIELECRFNIKRQGEYGIALTKNGAIEFLQDFGITELSASGFKKRHTRAAYENKFDRLAPFVGKNSLACTYAEWLHLEDFLFEPELPQVLLDLLPEGWTVPSGDDPRGNLPRETDSPS